MASPSTRSCTTSHDHVLVMRTVTAIMVMVIALTFLFGFGNVLTLGLRLDVPAYVAPLVAPAVDLSVLGLLLGVRHLALNAAPREQIRPARRLLILASVMTLALNITEPLVADAYGKAAFDAVGPLLLIGWAEAGPGLLQAISNTAKVAEAPTRSAAADTQPVEASPPSARRARPAQQQKTGARTKRLVRSDAELLQHARAEDARHRQQWGRPISAETLRKSLGVGAEKSRALVAAVRSERQHPGTNAAGPEAAHRDHADRRETPVEP
jgi:hypothetical protein